MAGKTAFLIVVREVILNYSII